MPTISSEHHQDDSRPGWKRAAVGCYWTKGPYSAASVAPADRTADLRRGGVPKYELRRDRQLVAERITWAEVEQLTADEPGAGSDEKEQNFPGVRTAALVYLERRRGDTIQLNKPKLAAEYLIQYLRTHSTTLDDPREHAYILALDLRNRLLVEPYLLSVGNDAATHMGPSEIYRFALLVGAQHLILAHTHPSGDVQPNDIDRTVTKQIQLAGDLFGIEICDHLILAGCHRRTDEPSYYSFREGGLL